ncbi:hypothetical protein B0H13DRAFT_2307085 [Mycena leptocephala]|nr:hypothetical protein B0H13DRAFT_2307085 [Mycena leptocephala]
MFLKSPKASIDRSYFPFLPSSAGAIKEDAEQFGPEGSLNPSTELNDTKPFKLRQLLPIHHEAGSDAHVHGSADAIKMRLRANDGPCFFGKGFETRRHFGRGYGRSGPRGGHGCCCFGFRDTARGDDCLSGGRLGGGYCRCGRNTFDGVVEMEPVHRREYWAWQVGVFFSLEITVDLVRAWTAGLDSATEAGGATALGGTPFGPRTAGSFGAPDTSFTLTAMGSFPASDNDDAMGTGTDPAVRDVAVQDDASGGEIPDVRDSLGDMHDEMRDNALSVDNPAGSDVPIFREKSGFHNRSHLNARTFVSGAG